MRFHSSVADLARDRSRITETPRNLRHDFSESSLRWHAQRLGWTSFLAAVRNAGILNKMRIVLALITDLVVGRICT